MFSPGPVACTCRDLVYPSRGVWMVLNLFTYSRACEWGGGRYTRQAQQFSKPPSKRENLCMFSYESVSLVAYHKPRGQGNPALRKVQLMLLFASAFITCTGSCKPCFVSKQTAAPIVTLC